MTAPTDLTAKIYNYELPQELIAHVAAEPRDSARLLRWPEAQETAFSQLPEFLNPGDLLILNTSKVIPARLYGTRPAREEGKPAIPVEFLLHRPLKPDLTEWQTFAKPTRRLKEGDTVTLEGNATATVLQLQPHVAIRLNLNPQDIPAYLEAHGHTPLPPYIHAEDTAATRAPSPRPSGRRASSRRRGRRRPRRTRRQSNPCAVRRCDGAPCVCAVLCAPLFDHLDESRREPSCGS